MSSLFGFTSLSFEQFVQTIAIHIFGHGVTVFGRGPDGGREATFEGPVLYPSHNNNWNGYGVIQAKYKEKTEGTSIDQDWALRQLKQELDNFVKNSNQRRRPEYYIFVTNVVLTPVERKGGKDRADDLIRQYYTQIGLRDHRIWDQDQLNAFVEDNDQIRRRYNTHFTTGDLLYAIGQHFELSLPDIAGIGAAFLEREFRGDQDAKLHQAGQRSDDPISLAKVFYDLPVTREPSDIPPEETEHSSPALGFVARMLNLGSLALDPVSLSEHRHNRKPEKGEWSLVNRIVLIGGPGSGKSTLSQFLAQIHRAAYLKRRPKQSLLTKTLDLINEVTISCATEDIQWPSTPRFVFRLELSAFATLLAEKKVTTFTEYLIQKMSPDRELAVDSFLKWFASNPNIVILDGLDEVPTSSNRTDLCECIQNFLAESARLGADMLLIATTRSEGYNNEFGGLDVEYRYLPPLALKRALRYVEKYATALYGPESPRIHELTHQLSEAAANELTAKLMRTPLQVAFLATLVNSGGHPPKERWRLFNDYYDTIYKREQQKGVGSFKDILSKHSSLVQRLHHDTGFLLQARSEHSGKTESLLSIDEFSTLIETRLIEEEWNVNQREEVKKQIIDAARLRLVFLTEKMAGKIGFDIRSLQEFMAAERIMSGPPNLLARRLLEIATAPYWRNTLLFCIGRCFAQAQFEYVRSSITTLCQDLNEPLTNPDSCKLYPGSHLALDILEDGIAAQSPRYTKAFSEIALQAIKAAFPNPQEANCDDTPLRLAQVCDVNTQPVFEQTLRTVIKTCMLPESLFAWRTLFELIQKGQSWAAELAKSMRPTSDDELRHLARAVLATSCFVPELLPFLELTVPRISPNYFRPGSPGHDYPILQQLPPDSPEWLQATKNQLMFSFGEENCHALLPGESLKHTISFHFEVIAKPPGDYRIAEMPRPSIGWQPYILGEMLLDEHFSLSLLSDTFQKLLDSGKIAIAKLEWQNLPWPIGHLLLELGNSPTQLLEALHKGKLGSLKTWQAAQARWIAIGIHLEELGVWENLPFDDTIDKSGFPVPIYWWMRTITKEVVTHLVQTFENVTVDQTKKAIAELIIAALSIADSYDFELPRPFLLRRIIDCCGVKVFRPSCLCRLQWPSQVPIEYAAVLGGVLESQISYSTYWNHKFNDTLASWIDGSFIADSSKTGLLHISAYHCCQGYQSIIPADWLDHIIYESDESRARAALAVRLSIPSNEHSVLNRFCTRVVELSKNGSESFIEIYLTVLRRHQTVDVETAVLNTLLQASEENEQIHLSCIRALHSAVSRKSTNLLGKALELQLPIFKQ